MSIESMKLALKAHHKNERHNSVAETNYWCNQYKLLAHQAIEALAKQEQGEPVAKVCHDLDGHIGWNPNLTELPEEGMELYTKPQPKRKWVGLTDEQFAEACRFAENGNYLVAFQRIQHWIKENNT